MKNYIFGYGSLIEKNSRGRTTPSTGDGYPVTIKGYIRGWWGRTGVPGLSTTFLGCLRREEMRGETTVDYVNGIVYEVKEEELRHTDIREQGYTRIAVKKENIDDYLGVINEDGVIWIYLNNFKDGVSLQEHLPTRAFPIVQSYIDICINGCLETEALFPVAKERNFTVDFILSTQYWSRFWVNDRIYPRRPFIAIPNAYKIDLLLQQNLPDTTIFNQIYFE